MNAVVSTTANAVPQRTAKPLGFEGLMAAPFTPFGPDGALNLDAIPAMAASLHADGVRGAFVCGTTGEGSSLSTAERKLVAGRWREALPACMTLVVHVGHNCSADAAELAGHAAAIGADAIAALTPSFFLPATAQEMVAFLQPVAAAAPALPLYYYHIPALTRVAWSARSFLDAAQTQLPTLAGIKFTHENLLDFSGCLHHPGGWDCLFGRDEMLLAALATGARGGVGSTYNFAAPIYLQVMEAFAAGDMEEARRHQQRANAIISLFAGLGGLVAAKEIMRLRGVDCGPVRPPLQRLSPEKRDRLETGLRELGFLE